jgi:hypothetical protein
MLNVAVWGLGTHAFKNVLPAVVASGAAKLVGVCSREEASRRRASREFGCAAWPDATAMLADDRVNTVYLATPIGLHFEQGLNVLRSGRHLICEKSLTDSHVKSIGLVAEARQRQPPVIQPEPFDDQGTRVICYPGDPGHSLPERAFPGPSRLRFVGGRFEPEGGLARLLD